MPLIKRGSTPAAEAPVGVVTGGPVPEPMSYAERAAITSSTQSIVHATEPPAKAAKAAPSYSDAKDRRISRQGLYQAALQSQALMQYCPTMEDYLAMVERVAEKGLEFVNRA